MFNQESEFEITDKEFKEIINLNELVVVDFFAEWCMPCLMMLPVVDEVASRLKNIKFVKLNIDDNHELASKHNVSSVPCLIVFKKGKEIHRISGTLQDEELEKKIKNCL